MLANKLMSALSSGAEDKLYVDDVFSTYLYTGNGATQTINNGIDLAGKGGLVWMQQRTSPSSKGGSRLYDTARGSGYELTTTNGNAQNPTWGGNTFNSNGFTMNAYPYYNESGATSVIWTFRKAPKFFDVVTYTGDGVAERQIPHELGCTAGMVVVKCTSTSGDWLVQARATSNSAAFLKLNSSGSSSSIWNSEILSLGTPTVFTVGSGGTTDTNINGATYVAYLFAHDPSADGIIQCGGVTSTAGGAIPAVNLGWEPQYILYKNSGAAGNWEIWDSSRNWSVASTGNATANALKPNLADAETGSNTAFTPTATGFYSNANFGASQTFIYLAIRRPNKPPTTGTQVYNAIARNGTGAATTVTGVGFAPDLLLGGARRPDLYGQFGSPVDRLRGTEAYLDTTSTGAETSSTNSVKAFTMDGCGLGTDSSLRFNYSGGQYIHHFFKRAPGFFDVVCYTGGNNPSERFHTLGATPELYIVKPRSITGDWQVFAKQVGSSNYQYLRLNTTEAKIWNTATPTETTFCLNTDSVGVSYVAYLFASLPGISKVGNYTGNGTTQTINCGFTTGARFILIKRTDSTGDWYVWDTARGIVSANDPHLSLNTAAAEVTTDDSVDPANSGFIVNQVAATNINVAGGSYIYFSVA